MNKNHAILFLLLTFLTVILLQKSCSTFLESSVNQSSNGSQSETIKPTEDSEDIVVGSEPLHWGNKQSETFDNKVRGLMKNRDFAALDSMAAGLRAGKERFEKGGEWKIHSFYLITASPERDTEVGWTSLIRLLKDWKEATNSISAGSSLAKAYFGYAWSARGRGFVNEVSPKAWPVFQERMKMAAVEVEEASRLQERCYGYFEVLLQLGRGGDLDRPQFERAFDEAINYDRSYQYFYISKAEYMLPRWNGRPGELARFVENLARNMGEESGLEIYYLIVAALHIYKHEDFFKETGLSWRKTKKGFLLHERRHGASRPHVSKFLLMAWTAYDSQAMCNTVKRFASNDDFDPVVFKTPKDVDFIKNFGQSMCEFPKMENQSL